MARKLRYEMAGGLYHVINRGNFRQPVFATAGAAQAFEKALWEAVRFHGWRVHAYVLMTNHYHLALETPVPNLVDGMHWLQSTFATRFNRFRAESGHLFQGRYQALAVEDSAVLANVVDYIHLNPVRAKMVEPSMLEGFRWSSLRKFVRGERPEGLSGDLVMPRRGLLDNTEGWSSELARLRELAVNEAEQKRLGFGDMCKGWAIGTSGWKTAIAKTFSQKQLAGLERSESQALRAARWEDALREGLAKKGIEEASLRPLVLGQKDEPWRFELAMELRCIGASYAWITEKLGYASSASLRVRIHKVKINN